MPLVAQPQTFLAQFDGLFNGDVAEVRQHQGDAAHVARFTGSVQALGEVGFCGRSVIQLYLFKIGHFGQYPHQHGSVVDFSIQPKASVKCSV